MMYYLMSYVVMIIALLVPLVIAWFIYKRAEQISQASRDRQDQELAELCARYKAREDMYRKGETT